MMMMMMMISKEITFVQLFFFFLTRVSSQGLNGWDIVLTTHLHLVPRLGMSGAIPLLPLYAIIVCTQDQHYFLRPFIYYQHNFHC